MKKKKIFMILFFIFIFTVSSLFYIKVNGKNASLKGKIELSKSTDKEEYKIGENINVKYTFKPKDISKDELEDNAKKDAEIVLVLDKSGSMNYSLDGFIYNFVEDNSLKDNEEVFYKGYCKKTGESAYIKKTYGRYVEVYEKYKYSNTWFALRTINNKLNFSMYDGANYYKDYEIDFNHKFKAVALDKNRLDLVKKASNKFISHFDNMNNVKISLVTFDSSINSGTELLFNGSFQNIKQYVNGMEPNGGTNIGEGLMEAHHKLKNSKNKDSKKYIVFLTDGKPENYTLTNSGGYLLNKNETAYVHWDGNDDPYGRAFEYGNLVAKKIQEDKENNIKSFMIAFSKDATGNKLKEISKSANNSEGYYREALTGDEIEGVYDKISEEIKSDLIISNLNFEETFPKGLEIISTPKGMNKDGNKVSGNLNNIVYKYDDKDKKYKADAVEFNILLKGTKENSYILGESEDSFINYNILYNNSIISTVKETFNPLKINIKNQIMDSLDISRSISPDKVKAKKEEFTMTYNINPKNIKANIQKKDLDIVLIIDKSESMRESLNSSNKDRYDLDPKGKYRMIYNDYGDRYYGILQYNEGSTEPNKIVIYYPELDENSQIKYKRVYRDIEKQGNVYKIAYDGYSYDEYRGQFYGFTVNMEDKYTYHSRMEAVQNAAERFIESFKNYEGSVSIGATAYESRCNIKIPLKDKGEFNELQKDINSIVPAGGTNIGDGLRQAYWMLKDSKNKNREKYIVLLTDGDPNYYIGRNSDYAYVYGKEEYGKDSISIIGDNGSKNGLDYAKKMGSKIVQDKEASIKSYMIAFTSDIKSEKLKAINDAANNGEANFYKEAQTKEDIDKVYEEIANSIKNDLTVKDIIIEETIPEGIEITDLPPGFKVENNKLIGKIGDINYILDKKTGEYIGKPMQIKVKAKGTKAGLYTLGEEKSSTFSYKDVNNNNIKGYLNETGVEITNIDSSLVSYGIYTNKTVDTNNEGKNGIDIMKKHLNISEDKVLRIPKDIKARAGFLVKVNNKESNVKLKFDSSKLKISNYQLYDANGEIDNSKHSLNKIGDSFSFKLPFNQNKVEEEKYYFIICDIESKNISQNDIILTIDGEENKIRVDITDLPDLM